MALIQGAVGHVRLVQGGEEVEEVCDIFLQGNTMGCPSIFNIHTLFHKFSVPRDNRTGWLGV